jgi:hypothetical protein
MIYKPEKIDVTQNRTKRAIHLIMECMSVNNISGAEALGAMSTMICSMLLHHKVADEKVVTLCNNIKDALASIGKKVSVVDYEK